MIIVCLLLCVIPVIFVLRFISIFTRNAISRFSLRKIPHPPGHWLWGNVTKELWNDTDKLFVTLRENGLKYWPIYRFQTITVTTVNLLHPSDIEMVLTNMKHMRKSKVYNPLRNWLGKGLLTSFGQHWQTRRKILTPAFHFKILKNFLVVFNEETEKLVNQIELRCNKPIDFLSLATEMSLNTIGETAMGMNKIDKSTHEQYKLYVSRLAQIIIIKHLTPWYTVSFLYRFTQLYKEENQIVDYLHEFAYRLIKSREMELLRNYVDQDNDWNSKRKINRMLDLLLLAKLEGSDIDLEGIREEVDTFMFAGHDTVSLAITFLLLNLANHQSIQETVYHEILDVIGTAVPTYESLQQLKYTERVVKESLRIFPSAPFISRVAGENFTTYTGYRIPKGTILNIHIIDLHRNPEIYPDPMKFDPDRFLPENCNRHPFAYIPFSAGPRNCMGQRFSILQIKAALCGIIRRFTVFPVDKPEDITFHPDLVLRPKTPIRVKFVPK